MSTVATDIQKAVEDAAAYLYVWALKDIPQDLRDAIRDARERETSIPGQRVLDTIIRNVSIADDQTTLVCQDTGIAVYYCRVGEHFPLHPARIYEALYDGTERATIEHPLRSNTVHTLTRENTGQNVGHRVPIVHWDFVADWDGLDVKCVPKGSGSENMSFLKMCVPADGVAGIKRFVLDRLRHAPGEGGHRASDRHPKPRSRRGEARGRALRPSERDRHRADGPRRRRHRPPVPRRARGHAHDPEPGRRELPVLGGSARVGAHRRRRDHRLRPGGLRAVAEHHLRFPTDEETIRALRAGDSVLVDGHIIGIRDRTQIRIFDQGVEPPMDLSGAFLLHTAPGVRKVGPGKYEPVSIGTTTSARMVRFTEPLGRDYGVRAICGKGGLPDEAIEPMKKLGMVYFAIVGGAAALETTQIEEIEEVAWEELMPECLWKFRVKDFGPLTVGIDAHGNSLYRDVQAAAQEKLKELYARL
jgi:L(+)-tartrate dehydratase beta subunit